MDNLFEYIESKRDYCISKLSEVVSIPSVSVDASRRQDVIKMGNYLMFVISVLKTYK